jgi:hypothetical protein
VTTKVYDGNTNAVITGTLSGIISPDVVTLNGTGNFNTRNVGTGKPVISTSTLGGADAGNYSLTQPVGLTGEITAGGSGGMMSSGGEAGMGGTAGASN